MKHGTGIGTGIKIGAGVGVENMAIGVGRAIGTGHGKTIRFGSQFSSDIAKQNNKIFLKKLLITHLNQHKVQP